VSKLHRVSYRPKFRLTSRLSVHLDAIVVLREKILSSDIRPPMPPQKEPTVRFTLAKAIALANGEDFPVVAERTAQNVREYFARRRSAERRSGTRGWTHNDIVQFHRVVTSGDVIERGAVGRYRSIPVRAGTFPPPRPDDVSELVSELLAWWNAHGAALPAVLTSAIVHYRIADIHPFADGNGRVGRGLALWELYRRGFDDPVVLPLHERYWGKRHEYYAALRAVPRRADDLTRWLEFSAERLRLVLTRVLRS
jgi:Fic family protein